MEIPSETIIDDDHTDSTNHIDPIDSTIHTTNTANTTNRKSGESGEYRESLDMPLYSRRGKKVTDSKQAKLDKLLNEETENYNLIKIINRGKDSPIGSQTAPAKKSLKLSKTLKQTKQSKQISRQEKLNEL